MTPLIDNALRSNRRDDETALIHRAAAGDESAFLALVDRHRGAVFNAALLELHDRIVADEVTQDAFVRLFQSLSRFRHEAALSTWLHRVTINLCRDVTRRRRRHNAVPLDDVSHRLVAARGCEPDRMAMKHADEEVVRSAIERLPADLRAAVSLRYGGGLSYAEIGRALRWPLGTVCTRLHRALKLLGQELGPRTPEESR